MSRSVVSKVIATTIAVALVIAGLLLPSAGAVAAEGADAPVGLRVNGLETPADLGDLSSPDFSWQVGAATQRAYRIVVASTAAKAGSSDGDVWDSGKVESSDQTNVGYGGEPLSGSSRYFWSVQTWDAEDEPSSTSATSWFGTTPGTDWQDSSPIWTAATPIPGADVWKDYTLTAKIKVTRTALGVRFRAADSNNSYMWQFRGADNRLVPHIQNNGTYTVLKTLNLPAGMLAVDKQVAITIEAVGSTIKTWINDVLVDTTTDSTHTQGTVGFRTGSTETGDVDDVKVVDASGATRVESTFESGPNPFPCGTVAGGVLTVGTGQACAIPNAGAVSTDWSFMRKETQLADKEIAWATIAATGTEFRTHKQYVYKLYINGEFVGLGPTNRIADEARFDGFDVTDKLKAGKANTIAALAYSRSGSRAFQAQLRVTYTDGTSDIVGTGADWKATHGTLAFPDAGSIGTSYFTAPKENLDARQYPFGYDRNGFDDSTWEPAVVRPGIAKLESTPMGKVQEQLHDPVKIVDKGNGNYFVDFGRTWIGGVSYDIADGTAGDTVDLRFGETTSAENTVRWSMNTGNQYRDVPTLKDGEQKIETWGMRVFRYLEIVDAPEPVTKDNLKALALVYPFDRDASSFTSSDDNLNQVYDLSKNTIESLNLNFYTDSWTRERTNYEADGYLQLQSSLYLMEDLSLGRYSMNYFKSNRTWPTEWPITVIYAVHDAWRQTGNVEQVAEYYDNLKTKLPAAWLESSTGLVRKTSGSSGTDGCGGGTNCDIVDWPSSQRYGYQFRQYNTVINSFYYRAMRDMAAMATEIGRDADAATYTAQADRLRDEINDRFYDEANGRYDDGMGADGVKTGHFSVHASAFALAFGVPEDDQVAKVADYVQSRGMECSVYCAGFLVKGLYEGGDGQAGLDALTGEGTSSWMNMIKLGAGATMEAWDPSQKSNLTYSHPWAASPAFNVPSGLFGIQPTKPGYDSFRVLPQPGDLDQASVKVPTVKGAIAAEFDHDASGRMGLKVAVPGNTEATVHVPLPDDVAESFVPRHAEGADYDGRTTIAGKEFATFTVGSGSWTFGPRGEQAEASVQAELSGEGDEGWYRAGAKLTLTTDAEDGVVTEFRIDGGEWLVYTAPVDLPNGMYEVQYRARLGDTVIDSGSQSIKVDVDPPLVGRTVEGRSVTLVAADGGSGLKSVQYRLGDGEWVAYDALIDLGPDAQVLGYRATDVAGNQSEESTVAFDAVYAGGSVTASVTNAGLDGWYGKGASLSLSVDPDENVDELQVRFDDAEWMPWIEPVALPDGATTISYRARGTNGAFSEAGELAVKVDSTPPTADASVDGRVVTLTAQDEGGSGVARIDYRLDGATDWTTYVEPITVDAAAHVIHYRPVDTAGNVGESKAEEVDAVVVGPKPAPEASAIPRIVGSAKVGRTLSFTPVRWDVEGVSTEIRWLRNGAPIDGATADRYTLKSQDAGTRISVMITATKPGYATGTVTSSSTAKVVRTSSSVSRSLSSKSVRSGTRVTLRVKVVAVGVTPTGIVDVYYRGRKVRSGLRLSDARLTATFRPRVRGTHTMKIIYRGDRGVRPSSSTITLRVR